EEDADTDWGKCVAVVVGALDLVVLDQVVVRADAQDADAVERAVVTDAVRHHLVAGREVDDDPVAEDRRRPVRVAAVVRHRQPGRRVVRAADHSHAGVEALDGTAPDPHVLALLEAYSGVRAGPAPVPENAVPVEIDMDSVPADDQAVARAR